MTSWYKSTCGETGVSFLHSASALCLCESYLVLSVCLSKKKKKMPKSQYKAKHEGESKSHYRQCVPPCKRYLCAGDTPSLCVVCLGARHAEAALEGADCPHCESLPLRMLRSRKALFSSEGSFISVPRCAGPASAEAERRQRSWGSQRDLMEGLETSESLSPSSPVRSHDRSPRLEAHQADTSPQAAAAAFLRSSSEEIGTENVEYVATPLSPQYEELVEVVTRAAAKLKLDWPAECPVEPQRGRLDERFLRFKTSPPHRSLPFFPDLHTEVSRSWGKPFSARLFVPSLDYYGNVMGTSERGYRAMPRVEQTLASYLSPDAASSLKAPTLPTKPLRTSSALLGKGYVAAGQAGACLHTMAVLQAYQADLLKELDEGEGFSAEDIRELRKSADLSLRATKETALAIGRSMAALVAAERHLWFGSLSDIKDRDRVFLMDATLSPSGLFGDAVDSVVDRHQEARRQAAAFQRFLPRCSLARGAAGREQPLPRADSSYREAQKESVAARAPLHKNRGRGGKKRRSRTSQPKPDLRTVLQAKRSSAKKPRGWWPRAYEGSPHWGRVAITAAHGARLAPVPSGDRSANPATYGVPGRSDLSLFCPEA